MSRDQWLILASALIPLALIALGMVLGWRALRRRQSRLAGLAPVPSGLGAALLTEDLLYVSTTPAERPLERIAVHGLGFRARAVLTVVEQGIVLELAGQRPGFIATSSLIGVGRATWTIDRAVSHDGLVFVRWSQVTTDGSALTLDSNFRSADPDALVAAIERIAPAPVTAPGSCRVSTADPAVLVLEDGSRYPGRAYGARGRTLGEAVFSTGMTGYQETLTDPSYAGQIVIMTAPHIGNTGMNDEDPESRRIWVSGYVVRDASRVVSNFRATRSLDEELVENGIVGMSGIDTRAVTRRLRDAGAMRAGVFSGPDAALSPDEQLAIVRSGPEMAGLNLSAEVSVDSETITPAASPSGERLGALAVLDLGIKQSTIDNLARRGFEVHVLPQSSTLDQVLAIRPVAAFYSNGPGDPEASDHHVAVLRGVLDAGLPFFGICFGNQLLGRALGLGTYKLPFGHRGINQPVLDKATGRVEITAHNHGFAVDAPREGVFDSPNGYGRLQVSHVDLNDGVVEGLNALDIPAFSVQYHPEAAAGPHDANYLFDRFADLVKTSRNKQKDASN